MRPRFSIEAPPRCTSLGWIGRMQALMSTSCILHLSQTITLRSARSALQDIHAIVCYVAPLLLALTITFSCHRGARDWPSHCLSRAATCHPFNPPCSQRCLNSFQAFNNDDCIDRTTRLATCMRFVHRPPNAGHWEEFGSSELATHWVFLPLGDAASPRHIPCPLHLKLSAHPSGGAARAISLTGPDGGEDHCNRPALLYYSSSKKVAGQLELRC